jgi:hypothetical protein
MKSLLILFASAPGIYAPWTGKVRTSLHKKSRQIHPLDHRPRQHAEGAAIYKI